MPDSFLMPEIAELTCGVCKDLFRNPYLLPCDHSFCRRPCLLPTPSSTCATCIYCHIGVHVSELERNYELDERVQSYLAKRRNLESQRVPCYLCRSLYDHCTMCSHCTRQLCDLCFKEHVGEFHTMIRIKCQSLQNEVSQLKQARANLVSRRTTVKPQRGMLLKSINSVSNDLLSACKTAFSRAEERLDRVQAQSHEKLTTMLNNQRLVELAVNLLRVLNDPAEHEFKRRLRRSLQSLQDACDVLKQLKKALAYSRDSAERISELPKRIDYATIALKSACESSFWRAETRLNRLEVQLMDKPFALLNKRNLIKNARTLLRTVNSPKQHEGIVNLCKVKETAQNAVETLRALAQLEAGQGHPALRNISVTDSLQSVLLKLKPHGGCM
nr:unnamed protein product [Spirometra erinaceieuropaei]